MIGVSHIQITVPVDDSLISESSLMFSLRCSHIDYVLYHAIWAFAIRLDLKIGRVSRPSLIRF